MINAEDSRKKKRRRVGNFQKYGAKIGKCGSEYGAKIEKCGNQKLFGVIDFVDEFKNGRKSTNYV